LTVVGLRAQRVTDYPFPAADIGFHQGTPVVPRDLVARISWAGGLGRVA
jgi:hypothetical protein